MASSQGANAPGSAGAGSSRQHPPTPGSVNDATMFMYECKDASMHDAWSAIALVHPEPTEENFRKVRVAVETKAVYRASHMAMGAPAGAAFLECRWCTILDDVSGLGTMQLRRFLTPAVLILQDEDSWEDLRHVFDNILTDQQSGPYMATALMWMSWPEIYCVRKADGTYVLGKENAGETLPPLVEHPGLKEGLQLLQKRPYGVPVSTEQPSGDLSDGQAGSHAGAKKYRVDLTGEDDKEIIITKKALEVNKSRLYSVDEMESQGQKEEKMYNSEKADAAMQWQGPDWQGQMNAKKPWAERIDGFVEQDIFKKIERTAEEWQDQLEELPSHKQTMVEDLANYNKVTYTAGKEPLEGLKYCTKKLWQGMIRTMKEELAQDLTLTLKFEWDMERALVEYFKTLKEGTGVASATWAAWLKAWKAKPVYDLYMNREKAAMKLISNPAEVIVKRLGQIIAKADEVFTDVLEGLQGADQARSAHQAKNDLTSAVAYMLKGKGQQTDRGFAPQAQPQNTYQPYGGRGNGGGRGRDRGAPGQIPPELYMPQAFVNTHINGLRGTPDRRCMTHMRAMLKGSSPCTWGNNCRNGSHDPATPEAARALLAAWEAAGRPDRVATRQGAT